MYDIGTSLYMWKCSNVYGIIGTYVKRVHEMLKSICFAKPHL